MRHAREERNSSGEGSVGNVNISLYLFWNNYSLNCPKVDLDGVKIFVLAYRIIRVSEIFDILQGIFFPMKQV